MSLLVKEFQCLVVIIGTHHLLAPNSDSAKFSFFFNALFLFHVSSLRGKQLKPNLSWMTKGSLAPVAASRSPEVTSDLQPGHRSHQPVSTASPSAIPLVQDNLTPLLLPLRSVWSQPPPHSPHAVGRVDIVRRHDYRWIGRSVYWQGSRVPALPGLPGEEGVNPTENLVRPKRGKGQQTFSAGHKRGLPSDLLQVAFCKRPNFGNSPWRYFGADGILEEVRRVC